MEKNFDEFEKPPPSYEESIAPTGVSPYSPSINEGFNPDRGFSAPSAPSLQSSASERASLNLGTLTDEDLREACLAYVSDNCCYGSKFVKDMFLAHIENDFTFHYQLESFGEKRQSVDRKEGYRGQMIDGPENGPPPDPWDIDVFEPAKFTNHRTTKEIPHTAYVKQCGECVGNGRIRCSSCYGAGGERCWSCSGTGRNDEDENCSSCNGSGYNTCYRCDGSGQVECPDCDGYGRLKHYKLLIVTWTNHVSDFISETFKLPRDLIREATGREVYREQNTKVYPIVHCSDRKINAASEILIKKHDTSYQDELIRQQRQTLRAVPLTRAFYKWKHKEGEFYVFGFQKKVYFEDYPQPCCCCTCL